MATYPTYQQERNGSTEDAVDDLVIDRAANGSTKGRSFATRKRKWTLRHLLTEAEISSLESFYDTNKTTANTFVFYRNRTTYTFLFEAPPRVVGVVGDKALVEVRMVQQ